MKLRNKKTGELGELQTSQKHIAVAVGNGTSEVSITIYDSINELNKEWEDVADINVTNIEPLIKDTKIRQCVKLWTEVNGYCHSLMYAEDYGWCSFYELLDDEELLFRNCQCPNLKNREKYSIAELCGEEEECES